MKERKVSKSEKKLLSFSPSISQCLSFRELVYLPNCCGTVVFLWLTGGKGYWFWYEENKNNNLIGYILKKERWCKAKIDRTHILRYY